MSTKILVPLDGSELSERVLPWVRLLAARLSAPVKVKLLRCYEPPSTIYLISDLTLIPDSPGSAPSLPELLSDYLGRRESKLSDVDVSSELVTGEPASCILEKAESFDLVLMASHGRGGIERWLMGSVTTKVVRGARAPVLVVSARSPAEDEGGTARVTRLLVGVDGSPVSERAFQKAADLAHHLRASLYVYQGVAQATELHAVIAEANKAEMEKARAHVSRLAAQAEDLVEVHTMVGESHGKAGIVEYAQKIGADLVVVGSHGRSGLTRWMLGSQAEHVLNHAPCAVLVTH